VLAVNAAALGVGYCLLWPALVGRGAWEWLSYAGIALLLGVGLTALGVFVAVTLGARANVLVATAAAMVLAGAGVACRFTLSKRVLESIAAPAGSSPARSPGEALAALVLGFGTVAVALLSIVGGFRSGPWLDDASGIWLPKAVMLGVRGLDPRLFASDSHFVFFEVPDYPLWWSSLISVNLDAVGTIDARALDAQLALLAAAFVGAVARLLWAHVRAWVLFGTLLLVVASPAFFRLERSGGADLPLALFIALTVLCTVGWLATLRPFYLLLVAPFAATAFAIKSEGLPQLLVYLAVLSALGVRRGRRALVALWIAVGVALVTAAPWTIWRAHHGIRNHVPVGQAFDPGYLADHLDRVRPTLDLLARTLPAPSEWALLVPLFVVLAIAGSLAKRSLVLLAPLVLLAAGCVFWIWVYVANQDNLYYLLGTSGRRVLASLVLTTAALVPLQVEALLRRDGMR
jgi:hypothetical protein